jgi:hypothetical protein
MAMVEIRELWIRMKLTHWIELQIQSTPIVLCSVISKKIIRRARIMTLLFGLSMSNVREMFGPILAADFSNCAAALQSGGVTADDGNCTEKFRKESERSPCMLDPYQND